jgi:6-phospho-beta-glucosidase
LLQQVKAYEQLTIQAALTGSRKAALEALMTNPLVGSVTKAREYFNLMVASEGEKIPHFI